VAQERVPDVLEAAFVAEVRDAAGLPPEGAPEIAIAGRSNVGKSTLLNRLAARHALARTSKTPGRTRGLIFYDLVARFDDARTPLRLVDLPGYGYARVSQEERRGWQRLVEGYVEGRASLRLFLILVDARRDEGLAPEEAQLIEWLGTLGVPYRLVITKTDKLSAAERGAAGARLRGTAGKPPLMVSGVTGDGVAHLWRVIRDAMGDGSGGSSPA
jgi:GTP-binding protein